MMLLVRQWRYNRATPEARMVMVARWAHQLASGNNIEAQGTQQYCVNGLEITSRGELGVNPPDMTLALNCLIYKQGVKVFDAQVTNLLDSQAQLTERATISPGAFMAPGAWVGDLMYQHAVLTHTPRRAFSWIRP
jgi:hypothetical protein